MVLIHHIRLHKAEPHKLVSLRLYSQRLKVQILNVYQKVLVVERGSEQESCSDSEYKETTISLSSANIVLKTSKEKLQSFSCH